MVRINLSIYIEEFYVKIRRFLVLFELFFIEEFCQVFFPEFSSVFLSIVFDMSGKVTNISDHTEYLRF